MQDKKYIHPQVKKVYVNGHSRVITVSAFVPADVEYVKVTQHEIKRNTFCVSYTKRGKRAISS